MLHIFPTESFRQTLEQISEADTETVPLTPPFARRLENKLMTLVTSTHKKKVDYTSMSKLSVENTMLNEKLKEQKKLVISLQKQKRKLEHQVEAF